MDQLKQSINKTSQNSSPGCGQDCITQHEIKTRQVCNQFQEPVEQSLLGFRKAEEKTANRQTDILSHTITPDAHHHLLCKKPPLFIWLRGKSSLQSFKLQSYTPILGNSSQMTVAWMTIFLSPVSPLSTTDGGQTLGTHRSCPKNICYVYMAKGKSPFQSFKLQSYT